MSHIQQILGLALVSMMGLFAARAAESPSLVLGNGFNRTVSYQSVTGTDTVGAALHYSSTQMQPYKGCRLTEVHIDLGTLTGSDSVRVFIGPSLTGKPLYEARYKQQKEGWNTFALSTPLTLDGSETFIGYEVVGTRMLRYSNPLVSGEEWLRKNNEKGWQLYEDVYAASLYAKLEGDVPRRNLVMGTTVMPSYAKTGEPMAFSGLFVNLGADTIRSLTFSLLVDGKPTATQTLDGLNVLPRKRGSFTLDAFKLTEAGDYEMALEASQVNGEADAYPTDNRSRTTSLLCRDTFTRRKVLMEVFSTENCTGCPAGHRTIANVLGGKTDIVEIGHHAGYYTDTFTVEASVAYEWFYKEHKLYAPAVMFDRTMYADNYPSVYSDGVAVTGVETTALNAGYTESAATPAYVSIEVTPAWDEATRRLSVSVSGHELLPIPQPDSTRLHVMLTEDSVFSTTQRNSEGSFHHRYVLRQTLTPIWGEPIRTADGFSRTYEATIPKEWNAEKLQAVAFVANHDGTDKTNCRVHNAAEASAVHPEASAIRQLRQKAQPLPLRKRYVSGPVALPEGAAAMQIYDLQGRHICTLTPANPKTSLTQGIYLTR